jgi:hypothetical protein
MVFDKEGHGEDVSEVMFAGAPCNDELVSGDAIAYPVVLYFYTFLCHFQYSGIVVRAC